MALLQLHVDVSKCILAVIPQLQNELADIENKLAAVRRFFNSATRELNNAVQTFPSNLIAGMFGFKTEPMFEIPTEQRAELDKAPEVKF